MNVALQTAIYSALTAIPAYRVYDGVPEGTKPPYVVIGEWTGLPDEDLSEADALDATLTIHAFSAFEGKDECLNIREWIRQALNHKPIAGTWACFEEFVEVFPEGEGVDRLFHLVVRYRLRTN